MSNVRLAIRVRPFTDKELKSEKERVRVVNVLDSKTVTITNLKVSVSGAGDSRERVRRYQADYTFDSACSPNQLTYASQDKVFETIGCEVLNSVYRGYSACVLAYGQSATGKTHTMMGTEAQPGLVPRICRALANRVPFDITVSFLEIYNERVHDLLVGEALPVCHSLPRRRGNARKDLRVREHPTKGPYVQNLRRVAVKNVEDLLSLVREGSRRRHTAATRRNPTSSRSHALLALSTSRATLHLADLAGSEKASWEGCGGGRQKEGANINKSLVALSNVISALVTNGFGKIKFVPYRDSALTWLLKDCFTGGASSFIIATVSPSVACYGESASTLRWAARARQLPSTSPQLSGTIVPSKADLQAQLDLLIAELANDYIRYVPETGKISYDDIHWTLQKNKIAVNSENKIGAFLDIMHRKSDSRNEESPSSLALSDSSDFTGAEDKNKITNEINKEVDKILGTSLERTSSGCDLKPPLRHKRREYRSQEVLPINETIDRNQEQNIAQIVNSHSDIQINTNKEQTDLIKVPHASIIHENQRSEIVAAVTERLYSKLKKKEIPAIHKMESIVDKKIVEPLSELRICTNARQRLIELSQKAIRNKRKIGIPVSTQTRVSVIRVKDKAVDVQADLDSYIVDRLKSYSLYRDVATETIAMTPRCKEQSVGPAFGSMRFRDFSTSTEIKKNSSINSYTMTDICGKCDNSTQTQVLPPPRRKKRCTSFPKNVNNSNTWNVSEDATVSPVISINISQTYPVESDSQSSDENSNTATDNCKVSPKASTPDLLTNHTADAMDAVENHLSVDGTDSRQLSFPYSLSLEASDVSETQYCEHEFSDSDEHALPRVKVGSLCQNKSDIKDLILGRNKNMFPYNIMLSPEKVKDSCKRTVSFKDFDIDHAMKMATKANQLDHEHVEDKSNYTSGEGCYPDFDNTVHREDTSLSDSTGSSKMETDSFIWKSNKTLGCSRGHYVPVYKPSKYNTTKTLYTKDLSRLEKRLENELTPIYIGNALERNTEDCHSLKNNYHDYKIFENMNKRLEHKLNTRRKYDFPTIEKNILASCEKLECIANKYDDYVSNIEKVKENSLKKSSLGTPTEYLQRLIQIRKSVIKSESEDTDSSFISHK